MTFEPMQHIPDLQLIKVEQHHIDMGKPRDGHSCPIYHAIQEVYPDCEINISKIVEIWPHPCVTFEWQPSQQLAKWVSDFDKGLQVNPILIKLIKRSKPSMTADIVREY